MSRFHSTIRKDFEERVENSIPSVTGPLDWLKQHGNYLYSFAFARVRHAESAEDLVQETLLAAWKHRDDFNGVSSERTWLTAILKRKIIDFLRCRIRDREKMDLDADQFVNDLFDKRGEWRSHPTHWNQHCVEALDREKFWTTTYDCLSKLPSRLQDIFVLRYLDQVTAEQLCVQMQVSSSNLWVMLHRARVRMWSCLSKNWFQEDSSV